MERPASCSRNGCNSLRKFIEIRRDEMILDLSETSEPESRKLIEDRAFVGNGIGQDHVESRKPIGHDK